MDLKKRFKNPTFWILIIFTIIPQLLQVVLPEYVVNYTALLDIVTVVCGALGIAIDPTTKGIKDSDSTLEDKQK